MTLRTGITTGTCAAAAAQAATMVLAGDPAPQTVRVQLPRDVTLDVPVLRVERLDTMPESVRGVVRKDAGDDPDVTDGLEVHATVRWREDYEIAFSAGEGVGTITKPGLQLPPGEPAINPVPRWMIATAIRSVTHRGADVQIAIPGGCEIAAKTFNPRLGIVGGLSILGTTGIVRPYSLPAMQDAIRCNLSVALACGVRSPVFVPGNIGARAARRMYRLLDDQVIEVSNEWGYLLDQLPLDGVDALLALGHPGKLVKLAIGEWDTHSSRSVQAVPHILARCVAMFPGRIPDSPTAEGIFAQLPSDERLLLGNTLAAEVRTAIQERIRPRTTSVAVCLVDMAGESLGTAGDLTAWR